MSISVTLQIISLLIFIIAELFHFLIGKWKSITIALIGLMLAFIIGVIALLYMPHGSKVLWIFYLIMIIANALLNINLFNRIKNNG
jgi:hypothetical protein